MKRLLRRRTRIRILRTGFLAAVTAVMTGGVYALYRFPRLREFAVILLISTILAIWLQIREERSGSGEEESEE